MRTSYPSTTVERGCAWCATCLYDAWGDVTEEQRQALGNLVVERFEDLAHAAGDPSIRWCPTTSEVFAECYGETTEVHGCMEPTHHLDADLGELRQTARDEVWDAVCGGETPMSERVAAILAAEASA